LSFYERLTLWGGVSTVVITLLSIEEISSLNNKMSSFSIFGFAISPEDFEDE
jgi:hypothetical protein